MRLIQATLVKEDVKTLTTWLEHEDLDYVLLPEEKEKFSHLLMLPVEDGQVDEVLSKLKGMGVDSEGYLTVSEIEAVVSEKIEKKQEAAEREGEKPSEKISREEIMARARELSRSTIR